MGPLHGPARRPAARSSTTWSPGCCHHWDCAPPIFHFNPGYERNQDYYLDVGHHTSGPTVWHSEDHYLDLVVRTGIGVELSDVDELLDAVRHGLLTPDVGEQAVQMRSRRSTVWPGTTTTSQLAGWQRHGPDLGGNRVAVGRVASMIL